MHRYTFDDFVFVLIFVLLSGVGLFFLRPIISPFATVENGVILIKVASFIALWLLGMFMLTTLLDR